MDNYTRPFLIAITGGIASGKTLVADWFADQGFEVHYADKIAHDIMNESEVTAKIIQTFGAEILPESVIDRRKLGRMVFHDPEKLKKLNDILHPLVRNEMKNLILLTDSSFLVFEIPLLFENGLQNSFDLNINIFTNRTNQIERVEKRDKLDRKEIIRRIDAQMSDFEKQKLADINIENNGTESELHQKMKNLLPLIKKLKKKEVKDILKI
ncbi:MAG: dephospho-CoA kinase [Candidatus Cloacimonadales bacterium]|nr:dephospho-CoA kinase [Candidatus Cloacimonadales bacterium]